MKRKIKKENIVLGCLIAVIAYQGYSVYSIASNQKEIEYSNTLEISYEEFHKMPTLITIIPEKDKRPGFIVRGFAGAPKIAFNDYKNNNIYYFEDYATTGANQDFIYDDEYGIFMINVNKSAIDNIRIESAKPEVVSSVSIDKIDKFIGRDEKNGLIFVRTKDNELMCYNIKDKQVHSYNIEGNRFKEIYDEISETGEVMDFFFVNDYKISENEIADGVSITYLKDNKMHKMFYRYYPEKHLFEKVNIEK